MGFAVLLAMALMLVCSCSASAADVGTAQIQNGNSSSVQKSNVQTDVDAVNNSATTKNLTDKNTKTTENTDVATVDTTKVNASTQKQEAVTAAVTSTSFTLDQIKDAAARVKAWIETNKKLPNYVTIGTTQVTMPNFLKLLTAGLLEINSGSTAPIALKTVSAPATPSENIKSGDISKANYLDLATRVNNFINTNGKVPNYASTPLGNMRYENMIYAFSRILNFQKINNRLPEYVSVTPWGTVTPPVVPPELQKYIVATTNCQVNDPSIKSLMASITNGATSTYDKAVLIFNWVRDHISYEEPMYYNTKYGAVGTLKVRKGNCCDTSHLLIALERAAGIPARYVHGKCYFYNAGQYYGHVWAQVYVGGKWYTADAISYRNTFGVIKNWNTATATIYNTYATLPF